MVVVSQESRRNPGSVGLSTVEVDTVSLWPGWLEKSLPCAGEGSELKSSP